MRLRLAFALSVVPLAFVSYLVACSSEQPIENLCGWIGDPNNCYRTFAQDIGTECGGLTDPQNKPGSSPRPGSFLKRDKLDLCVLDSAQGGQVIFDPALTLDQFPVTTASFAIVNGDGTLCGAGAVGPDGAMAISIQPNVDVPDGGKCSEDGGTSDGGAVLCGGTFSVKSVTARELIDTSCPNGEKHHFNRLQLSKCDGVNDSGGAKEPNYAQLMPHAEFESSAGGVGKPGYVRFRVYYPPTAGELDNAPPTVVEYFECRVPAAPATCTNKVQDEGEPNVDCGIICGKGCGPNSACYVNADCTSKTCAPNGSGLLTCVDNPNCSNMEKDIGEADVDCGTICNEPCAAGKTCMVDEDCAAMLPCKKDGTGTLRCGDVPDAGGGGAGGSGGAGGAGGGP